MRAPRLALAVFLGALSVASAHAQSTDVQPPAHVAHAEGYVVLEREGELFDDVYGLPFVAGDLLRTQGGRAEVLFADGSLLHLDDRSAVEILDDTLLRLTEGRLLLVVAGARDAARALKYQIDTPTASVFTESPGEFRVALLGSGPAAQAELSVVRGYASLSTDFGTVALNAGERSLARDGAAPAYAQAFNSARFDAFDRWSLARRGERVTRAVSSQYLPADLRVYGSTFDRYGSWEYEESHGYVWYPSVHLEWRPYHHGYWRSYPRYGWTWIGLDPWGWPTHHYGRWGYKRSRWYWIPDRVWGPAWVHWVGAPAYIGWSPLGFDNRPIFAFAFSTPNVWASWVVVPRTHFGNHRYYVHHYAVPGHRIPGNTVFTSYAAAAPVVPPHRDASVRRAPAGGQAVARVRPDGRAAGSFVSGRARPAPQERDTTTAGSRAALSRTPAERRAGQAPAAREVAPSERARIPAPARTAAPRSAVRAAPREAGTAPRVGADGAAAGRMPRSTERPSAIRRSAPRDVEAPARPEPLPDPSRVSARQAAPRGAPQRPAASTSPERPAGAAPRGIARPRASGAEVAPRPPAASPSRGDGSTRARSGAPASPPPAAESAPARRPEGESGSARRRSR